MIYLDDCLKVFPLIPDESIDLLVTDCPYKIVQGGRTNDSSPKGGIFSDYHEEMKKGTVFSDNTIKFDEWLPHVFKKLKKGTHAYIMINGRNLKDLQVSAEKAGFEYQNLLVWNKSNKTPNRYYMQQLEFILLLRKGSARSINDMGSANLFNIPNQIGKKEHPTQKPASLLEIFIKNSSHPGDTVLDPFMGSGSTGVACNSLKRNFIGIEVEERYFNIAKKNISEFENVLF